MSNTLLDDLYKEIILDHYRQPRNKGELTDSTCSANGANPLCGDEIQLQVTVTDDLIEQIAFTGAGCSISQAASSMMTEYAQGRSVSDALAGVTSFQEMMTTGIPSEANGFDDIDALTGVAKFPARVKCASLSWKTLEQALDGNSTATTE